MFSGSYAADDVIFLLKPVQIAHTDLLEKERLIQAGRHYSEMISYEAPPAPEYLSLFFDALARERRRFARDLLGLAEHLYRSGKRTIVSLARAGTPVGVLVSRALRRLFHVDTAHYSISIIRDRGIDENALKYVIDQCGAENIAFIDGWSAKGVIATELRQSVDRFNSLYCLTVDPSLYVVADIGGNAGWAASTEDYLIPSSLLGATISGLVSRSILNDQVVGAEDFHGCIYYNDYSSVDLSRWFADEMFEEVQKAWQQGDLQSGGATNTAMCRRQEEMREWIRKWLLDRGVASVHFLKPGIGEATRVMLRRIPDLLLVRDRDDPSIRHLLVLAQMRGTTVEVDRGMPFRAAAIIKKMDKL
ncbi:MAG: cysteine protease StiP family protein [Gemmataceae bacterium]|nr:cysteine protease StiP family protein [Gemmataceae bacterium]